MLIYFWLCTVVLSTSLTGGFGFGVGRGWRGVGLRVVVWLGLGVCVCVGAEWEHVFVVLQWSQV